MIDDGASFNASSAIITAATGSSARCASMNRPRRPSSLVSSRSAMARKARCAPSRSPSSCADCACSNSASGSCAACRRATSACARADAELPWPIASNPCVIGMPAARLTPFAPASPHPFRHAPHAGRIAHTNIAATTTMPSTKTNTGSVVTIRDAAPRQRDIAGLLGNPCRAHCCERDQHQEQNDPDHRNPY